jgi:methylglutaconyl-CoA hydratase
MEYVKTERRGAILDIILNRPDKRNALNSEFVAELTQAFQDAADDGSVRVIILKAEGKVFSAGADLAYLQQLQSNSFEENLADSGALKDLFKLMYEHPKIIIAQVEGHAIAGGCGLVTVCDFVYSVPDAQFGYTEVKIGFIPAIVMFFLIRKIGEAKARNLLLTGRPIKGEEFKELGIITEVVKPSEIEEEVNAFAERMVKETSPQSVAMIRKMIADMQTMPTDKALNYAAEQNAHARASEDCRRGISAFLNKEEIRWG